MNELIQTVLFFIVAGAVITLTIMVLLKKKNSVSLYMDIAKYVFIALITYILISQGLVLWGIVFGILAFGTLLYLKSNK